MKSLLYYLLSLLALVCFSCGENDDFKDDKLISDTKDDHLYAFSIDQNGDVYYLSHEFDLETTYPLWVSSIPMLHKLYKQSIPNGELEYIDEDMHYAEDLQFDVENDMIVRDYIGLLKICDSERHRILNAPLSCFAINSDNTIWAGNYTSGLYQVTASGDSVNYNSSNSILESNGVNAIYIDKSDVVWASLWGKNGMLKIDGEDWMIFDSSNSDLPSQDIWCIVSDKDNHLWVGMGYSDDSNSLMRFDGEKWADCSPNIEGKLIFGTVRKLVATPRKIYAVSVFVENNAANSNRLLSYDGLEWAQVNLFPEEEIIMDLEYDKSRNQVCVLTANNKLYRMDDF